MDTILSIYGMGAGLVVGFFAIDWYRHGSGASGFVTATVILLMALLWPALAVWIIAAAAWDFGKHHGQAFAARHHTRRGRFTRPGPRSYRWSGDNDRYWWRFTYANENRPDGRGREERRIFGLYLTSKGDEDEGSFCLLRGHLLGRTLILRLPALFQPAREWHEITTPETRIKLLRAGKKPGYWETWERSYGFLFQMGSLHIDHGRQTHDSSTDRSKVIFLPWRAWRHVRFSLYGLEGEHIWSQLESDRPKGVDGAGIPRTFAMNGWHDQRRVAEDAAPKVAFEFLDYDKVRITATTQIHEREWHLGEGRFEWLSVFVPAKVERSLSIEFSEETGRRKGSWKGGTIGASIAMLPGELHEAAFARYARAHEMTYPAPVAAIRVEGQSMGGFVPYLSSPDPEPPVPQPINVVPQQDAMTCLVDDDDATVLGWKLTPGVGMLIAAFVSLVLWGIIAGIAYGLTH